MANSTGDTKGSADGVASIRIRLKYPDEKSFIERFGAHVTRNGVFLASRATKPPGTVVRFELLLADGSRIMRGEGVVAWKRDFDARAPQLAAGMGLKYSKLDAETRKLVERIAQQKAARGEDASSGVPTAPLVGLDSGPVAIGGDTGPVASFASAQLPAVAPPAEDDVDLRALLDDETAGTDVLERARRIAAEAARGASSEDLAALDALLTPVPVGDAELGNLETASQALADMLGAPAPRLERRARERHKVAPVFSGPRVAPAPVIAPPPLAVVPAPPRVEEAPPLEPPPPSRPVRRTQPPPPPPSRKRPSEPMPFGGIAPPSFGTGEDRPVTVTREPARPAGLPDFDAADDGATEFGGGEATSISAGPAMLRELLGHDQAVDEDSLPAIPLVTRAGTESLEVNLDDDEGALLELDPDELQEEEDEAGAEEPRREANAIADLDAALDAALDLRVDGDDDKHR